MKEIRDIKLDILMGNQNPIVDLFNEITKDLKIINCEVYNDDGLEFIYYNKENEWIFYQDAKNGEFWVHYNRYWKIFESEFKLGHDEIQAITKFLVEEVLKRELNTPPIVKGAERYVVEEVLKRELNTPILGRNKTLQKVEEVLKREIGTPLSNAHSLEIWVEEVFKREVATPKSFDLNVGDFEVGEALKRELNK